MFYMSWNEFCMILVMWQFQNGSSRHVWSLSLTYDYYSSWLRNWKKKFVLKCFLCHFKGFKLIFKKKDNNNNGKSVHHWPKPPTLMENSISCLSFWNPSLMVLINIEINIYIYIIHLGVERDRIKTNLGVASFLDFVHIYT